MNPLTSLIYAITRAIFDAYFDAQRASLKSDIEKHDPHDDVLGDRFRVAVERVRSESSTGDGGLRPEPTVPISPASAGNGVGKDK